MSVDFNGSSYKKPNEDHAVRIALLEQATESIQRSLAAINVNISRLVWIVAATLITGIVQFILKGGLK